MFKSILYAVSFCLAVFSFASFSEDEAVGFNQSAVELSIKQAYQLKSARYTDFAVMFNFCQQKPTHSDCGEKYAQLQSDYQWAEANYKVLLMVWQSEFRTLLMPKVSEQELTHDLQTLGYVESSQLSQPEAIQKATAKWLSNNDMTYDGNIYLLHQLMIRTEAMASSSLESQL
tara:strand:+ start:860 stop:1378 length:519 start_codon:yes stop_codon:yes gene_type:complete